MNRENEYEKALKIMQENKGATLLLQSCCAPCSSACLERLSSSLDVTVLYYNPNIEEEEYYKRKAEQIRLLEKTGWAKFLDCDHDGEAFTAISHGLEDCPERGARCYRCYELRLRRTALTAKENGYDFFSTTLSVSPYKVSVWINEIGYRLQEELGVRFLPSDFKKQGGYQRSVELSAQYGLYRQDFCGCPFSKAEAERRRKG